MSEMPKKREIIAVDFDGTLAENKFPDIGEPNKPLIEMLLHRQREYKSQIVLWTCRVGERLREAVEWCREQGLEFKAVNDNVPKIKRWLERDSPEGESRKIIATWYIDDKTMPIHNIPYMPYKFDYPFTVEKVEPSETGENG